MIKEFPVFLDLNLIFLYRIFVISLEVNILSISNVQENQI